MLWNICKSQKTCISLFWLSMIFLIRKFEQLKHPRQSLLQEFLRYHSSIQFKSIYINFNVIKLLDPIMSQWRESFNFHSPSALSTKTMNSAAPGKVSCQCCGSDVVIYIHVLLALVFILIYSYRSLLSSRKKMYNNSFA